MRISAVCHDGEPEGGWRLHILMECDIRTGTEELGFKNKLQDYHKKLFETEKMEPSELRGAISDLLARVEEIRDWL